MSSSKNATSRALVIIGAIAVSGCSNLGIDENPYNVKSIFNYKPTENAPHDGSIFSAISGEGRELQFNVRHDAFREKLQLAQSCATTPSHVAELEVRIQNLTDDVANLTEGRSQLISNSTSLTSGLNNIFVVVSKHEEVREEIGNLEDKQERETDLTAKQNRKTEIHKLRRFLTQLAALRDTIRRVESKETELADAETTLITLKSRLTNGQTDCARARNTIVAAVLNASDAVCHSHLASIQGFSAATNWALGTATNITTALATFVGGVGTKAGLAAAGNIASSTKTLTGEELFLQQVAPAITAKLRSSRNRIRKRIRDGLKHPTSEYSIETAMLDLGELHEACSFQRGIELISEDDEPEVATQQMNYDIASRRIAELDIRIQNIRSLTDAIDRAANANLLASYQLQREALAKMQIDLLQRE